MLSLMQLLDLSGPRRILIGVVHLAPTPGSPKHAAEAGLDGLLERARSDARALAGGGCDALIVENFGDAPFHPRRVPAETVAAMALAIAAVREEAPGLPVGVNVLRNDARAALGLCAAAGAAFVRVNVLCGVAVTDQGLVEGQAALLLRERARLAPKARILADVHVKHARPLGGGTIEQAAEDTARRGGADGLIVTGRATGSPPEAGQVEAVRAAAGGIPVLVGSGVTDQNAAELCSAAAGAICGTWLKREGRIGEPVDPERVRRLRAALGS